MRDLRRHHSLQSISRFAEQGFGVRHDEPCRTWRRHLATQRAVGGGTVQSEVRSAGGAAGGRRGWCDWLSQQQVLEKASAAGIPSTVGGVEQVADHASPDL
eukprot:scaffold11692_cov97-Isochrysis_galbana.AAC.8